MPGMTGHLLHMPARILAVAGVTFTQLMRMRLFVVMAVFAIGFLGLQFLPYRENLGVEFEGIGQLQLIKDIAIGCMRLFSMIFCVAATALLIPRDTEDRILYTILCKPVPRFDYLAGKALGVMALLGVMLLFMDVLMVSLLHFNEAAISADIRETLMARGYAAEDVAPYLQQVAESGNSWNVQRSLLAMYMGFGVLTTITLLFSCVTSGTIVSMIFALGAYFIGMFQGQLFMTTASVVGGSGTSALMQWVQKVFAILVPDFSLFSATDPASAGVELTWSLLGGLGLIAVAYMLLHLLTATWIFAHKEF